MRRALAVSVLVMAGVIAVRVLACTQPPPAVVLDEGALPRGGPALAAADAPASIEELRRRVAAVLAAEGVPGVAIALVDRDGPMWSGGVGVADRKTGVPVDADTVFRVASITKSVVGLGVMRLVEQDRLALDRPLRELMPEIAIDNAWEDAAPVTLAHVLEHTAGLDDMRPNETFTADDALTAAAALAIDPRSRRIRWRPGSRMAYSNVGYTLAGYAIEAAAGVPFDAWLRRGAGLVGARRSPADLAQARPDRLRGGGLRLHAVAGRQRHHRPANLGVLSPRLALVPHPACSHAHPAQHLSQLRPQARHQAREPFLWSAPRHGAGGSTNPSLPQLRRGRSPDSEDR